MNLIALMRDLVTEHDEVVDKVAGLWTWLPSYAQSKKRSGNAHYNRDTPIEETLLEASRVLAFLAGYSDKGFTRDEQEWIMRRFGPRLNDPCKRHDDWEFELPAEEEGEA